MATPHPIDGLFALLGGLRYPPGVVPTDALVDGPEFFPGGCGLWGARPGVPWPPAPVGGVLVLGHNLDSVESYRRNVATGGLQRGPTWRNLALLVDAAGVGRDACFLSNFFMGCGPRQVGAFPGASDPRFVSDCAAILRATIRALRPRAVLVLGRHTWRHLEVVAPAFAAWRGVRSFADLDERDLAVVNVTLEGVPSFGATAVVHPSGADMGGNRKKRRFRGLTGLDAEAAALRHALDLGSPDASR